MEFNSLIFLSIFFPLVFISYYFVRERFRNICLLLFGLFFYFWGSQAEGLILLLVLSILNYIFGCILDKKKDKFVLFFGIILNVLFLCYFKYTNFFLENINLILGKNIALLNIMVPLGISFFVFKAISYLVDVYKTKVECEKNIIDFLLYMTFFPQVLSGPIVRYSDMKNELKNRTFCSENIRYGLMRFVIGLAKKVFIANNLGILADSIWQIPTNELFPVVSWLGSISYTLQIYYDFSGYSDMAIGLASVFGFHFKENFDYPYISKSITEFWRRWHISLSSWFKDYVYIPLGGNRKGNVYVNIFIVFFLTGIWHGSAWNFIIWGLWNGVFNALEKFIATKGYKIGTGNIIQRTLSHIYTLFVVNIGWVLFRAPNFRHAGSFILSMFGLKQLEQPGFTIKWWLNSFNITLIIVAVIFSVPYIKNKYKKVLQNFKFKVCFENIFLILLLILCLIGVVSGSYNSFIYFQF